MVDCEVIRDLEKPARELELGTVSIEVVQNLDEGFLREVLGHLAIAHHPEDERKNRALITGEQLAVRGFGAFPGQLDDGWIGKTREWRREGPGRHLR
jgi:hypothetical protein